MKRKRFTEEQIAFALRQHVSGTSVAEIVRKMGISDQTFCRWKKKYEGLGVAELRRLKQVEEENNKWKQLVADLSLDRKMLQDVLSKKLCSVLCSKSCQVSQRRACSVLRLARSTARYRSVAGDRAEVRIRLRDLASTHVRSGCRRLHVLLRREGYRGTTSSSIGCTWKKALEFGGEARGVAGVFRFDRNGPWPPR